MAVMNVEAENKVLAGMMNNTEFLYDAITEAHQDMFTSEDNRELFSLLLKRSDERMTASLLMQEFQGRKKAHIRTVDGEWIDLDHSTNALKLVKESYIKRRLVRTLEDTNRNIEAKTADELIADIEQSIGEFYFDDKNENIIDPAEYAAEALSEFYEVVANPDKAMGIPFSVTNQNGAYKGFPSLDETFNGAQGGDLIMIAARTGEGKTGTAITLSRLFSLYQDYAGYYENAEMKIQALLARLIAPLARVDVNEIMYGKISGTEQERKMKMERISESYEHYRKSSLYLSRIPSLPLHKAKGLAKQVRNRYKKLDYLIVDYVGRMTIEGQKNSQTWDELYEITRQLKELAMDLNIPIFMLAQRNQAGDVEGAKKMKNECDGVLYIEPITDDDKAYIESNFREDKQQLINYKITKEKVRRNDNSTPIYMNYAKDMQFMNEVRR